MKSRIAAAFRAFFRRESLEREMDEEMRFHIEMETRKNLGRGMTPEQASTEALRGFGGLDRHKEEGRDASGIPWLESFSQDTRIALRGLKRNPAYALASIATLALGIGANVAVFSVVHAVFLQELPYGGGDRLVRLRQDAPAAGIEDAAFSPVEVADYRSQTRTLQGVVEYHSMSFILLGQTQPERVRTGVVSADFFDVFRVKPLLGRLFLPGEDAHGAEPVLLLSYDYWMKNCGGDPHIVGRAFRMNDKIHTVVGVLPPIPPYPDENDVFMPTSACPFRGGAAASNNRNARMVNVFGRLKPEVRLADVDRDLAVIAGKLSAAFPRDYPGKASGFTVHGIPLTRELTQRARPTFLILLATVALVLLLACANVANLTLARHLRRHREIALRSALGAGRGRLARQMLTESTVLSVVGGVLGLALAAGVLRLLVAFAARFTPRAGEIRIDAPVLLFALAISIATGIAFGLVPALSRQDNLAAALQESGRSTLGSSRYGLRQALIVVQVAVSFMLLIGAGLMLKSLWKLQAVDPGFDVQRVETMRVALNFSKYDNADKRRAFFRRLLDDLAGRPGVDSLGVVGTLPLNQDGGPQNNSFEIEGRPTPSPDLRPQADFQQVSPDYFRTIRAPLAAGRGILASDRPETPKIAVINQTMARHLWPSESPIERRITFDEGKSWITIVGIVGDIRQNGLDRVPGDQAYVALDQYPSLAGSILVRSALSPQAVIGLVRSAVRTIDPDQPVDQFRTLDELRANALASPRLTSILLAAFAALALLITSAGIAGVIAFSVTERTQEFGIRLALGAHPRQVRAMVLRQGMTMVAIGLALGFLGAHLLARLMSGLLFEVRATDPPTFLAMSAILAAVAAAACLGPARQATAVDPMTALRAS
ncbi:MAG TPA: ABC transporter permease [Thermoanaerobaculia bacterium]|nr:ABC transporter permease [Thermoanaerobaculia bacterium]